MSEQNIISAEDDSEEMYITLEFDDGDVECAIMSIIEVDGKDYIALLPLDENGENSDGELWFYRYHENPDDPNEEPVLDYIDDDEEFDKVAEAFDEYLDECEFDEIVTSKEE